MSDPAQQAQFVGGARRKARIEIIPLIDVIFFLLATFVLFTISLNPATGLKVNLPPTQTSQALSSEGAVTLTLTAEGTIAWDKNPVTLDEFIARLQAYKQTSANPQIVIKGDEKALFSQARYMINEVRKAGIRKILVESRALPAGA